MCGERGVGETFKCDFFQFFENILKINGFSEKHKLYTIKLHKIIYKKVSMQFSRSDDSLVNREG